MCWTCTCFRQCRTDIVRCYSVFQTKHYLLNISGKRSTMSGKIQCPQRFAGHVSSCLHNTTCLQYPYFYPYPIVRSFVLAYRIMKLIIAENGNNAWLSHGTPHLNVRNDFMDTETGIRRKQTYGAVSM